MESGHGAAQGCNLEPWHSQNSVFGPNVAVSNLSVAQESRVWVPHPPVWPKRERKDTLSKKYSNTFGAKRGSDQSPHKVTWETSRTVTLSPAFGSVRIFSKLNNQITRRRAWVEIRESIIIRSRIEDNTNPYCLGWIATRPGVINPTFRADQCGK